MTPIIICLTVGFLILAVIWLGLRFARALEGPRVEVNQTEVDQAVQDVEHYIKYDDTASPRFMHALLICRGHMLPPDIKKAAEKWLSEREARVK